MFDSRAHASPAPSHVVGALVLSVALAAHFFLGTELAHTTALAFSLLAIGGIILLMVKGMSVEVPRTFLLLLPVPLLCISLVSSAYYASWSALLLPQFMPDSLETVILFSAAFFLGTLVRRETFKAIAVCAFAVASIVFLWALSSFFGGESPASWQEGAFISIAALIPLALLGDREGGSFRTWSVVGAFLCLVPAYMFFHTTAVIAGLFVLGIFAGMHSLASQRAPFVSGFIGLVLLIMLVSGWHAPVDSLSGDVRPSWYASGLITFTSYTDDVRHIFLGTGSGNFARTWELYRPEQFNSTPLWSLTPESGYSTIALFATTLGPTFAVAFLLFPLMLFTVARVFPAGERRSEMRALAALILFVCISVAIYPVELFFLLVGAVACGVYVKEITSETLRIPRVLAILITVVLLGMLGFASFFSFKFLLAESKHRAAVELRNANSLPEAARMFEKASKGWGSVRFEEDASRAYLLAALAEAEKGEQADIETFESLVGKAIEHSDSVIRKNDLQSLMWRASLFATLTKLGGDYREKAHDALVRAKLLAPKRPDIPYFEAQLYVFAGEYMKAKAAAAHAVSLKPDYDDAKQLLKAIQNTAP